MAFSSATSVSRLLILCCIACMSFALAAPPCGPADCACPVAVHAQTAVPTKTNGTSLRSPKPLLIRPSNFHSTRNLMVTASALNVPCMGHLLELHHDRHIDKRLVAAKIWEPNRRPQLSARRLRWL